MKPEVVDWQNVSTRDALTVFMRLKARVEENGQHIERIYIHSRIIARGYVFVVENNNRLNAFINSYDLEEALAGLPEFDLDDFEGQILGIPVTEDTNETLRNMGGVFIYVARIGIVYHSLTP